LPTAVLHKGLGSRSSLKHWDTSLRRPGRGRFQTNHMRGALWDSDEEFMQGEHIRRQPSIGDRRVVPEWRIEAKDDRESANRRGVPSVGHRLRLGTMLSRVSAAKKKANNR